MEPMRATAFVLFCLLAMAPPPVAAAELDHAAEYGRCMESVKRDPQKAFDHALSWRGLGGGNAADHCAAAALTALGQYEEGARRLEALAQAIAAEPPFKAALLGHAAQGWMLDGQPSRAEQVLTSAIGLDPGNPALLVDRAMARAQLKAYGDAVSDLDAAIKLDPGQADAFALRASAHRFLDHPARALDDAQQALALRPDQPDALLERGILRRLAGDQAGARSDWMTLLRTAPDSEAARMARANLERMDVKKD